MLWLWIAGILAALVTLLCLIRVGVQATMSDGSAAVDVKIFLFRVRVFPGEKREKPSPKAKKAAGETGKKEKSSVRPSLSEIREAVRVLWPPLKRALKRTRRGILVKPLTVSVTLGGAEDPAGTAQLYGWLQAAVWTGMPELEQLLDIRDPSLHIGLDFDAPETALEGTTGVTIRIGTLLAVAFGVGIPALKWFLQYRKRQKKAERPAKAAA